MRKISRKNLIIVISAILVLSAIFLISRDTNYAPGLGEQGSQVVRTTPVSANRYGFQNYLNDSPSNRPDVTIYIEGANFSRYEGMEVIVLQDFEGMEGASVWTDEIGLIEWEVYVEEAGLYNLSVLYFSIEGKNADIQRTVLINGELPFIEASQIELRRTWVNSYDTIRQDNRGNDLRTPQVELHMWRDSVLEDSLGTYTEPFAFYLPSGLNSITFVATREPVVIRRLVLFQAPVALSYAEITASRPSLHKPSGVAEVIQGQDAARKSSPMLFPSSDNSSPAVYPYSPSEVRINNIGDGTWGTPGQWIEWDFYVEEAGLYRIAMNVKQNTVRGTSVFRRITINGEVPFSEMAAVPFGHANSWRMETLGGSDDPYLFWLEEGHHTIRMEVVLGDYAPYVRHITESIYILNNLYRQIVMITGNTPDNFRDYQLARRLPHLVDALNEEREILELIFEELTLLSGGNSSRDAVIRTLASVLQRMTDDIEESPRRLSMLRTSIGSLGTWLTQVREMGMAVESIHILSVDVPDPTFNNGFLAYVRHEFLRLFYSFIIDYSAIGNTSTDDEARTITVWVGQGRDQANVIKALIDENFTVNTGINVNLMLVDMNTLLPATLSGQGPDVAMMVANELPMNFGMRGAVADLTQFSDFEEVTQAFMPSAMIPFTFDGRSFALPETQTFNMLFYRADILEELGLDIPETWDDVRASMSVLSQNHMTFGLPVTHSWGGQTIDTAHLTFTMFLFQAGGELYNEDGSLSMLDSDLSVNTFREFTQFFTDFGLDQIYDFANRFRIGEMPLAIADYTSYNLLQVFAPELRGMWGFTMVPGTVRKDGTISHAVAAGGTASIIMERTQDADASWEFLRWWTSAETQVQFGRAMESLMGPAARYPTANQEALAMLPWPVEDFRRLQAQFQYAQGVPQVPGGYFTSRQINNAFYRVVTEMQVGPREALADFTRYINEEITFKRREFGID